MNVPPMPEWFKTKKWTDCTPEEQQVFRDYIRELRKAMQDDQPRAEDAVLAAAARRQR